MIAYQTGATVEVPIYPLIQQGGTGGIVVPKMAGLISSEVTAHGTDHVSVLGDSAGANIGLAAVEYVIVNNCPFPARWCCFPRPWTRLVQPGCALDQGVVVAACRDSPKNVGAMGRRAPVHQLLSSPLFGPLDRLPPTYVYAGSQDVTYPTFSSFKRRGHPSSPDQLRVRDRGNPRLDSDHHGRVALLAADPPGTRYLRSATFAVGSRRRSPNGIGTARGGEAFPAGDLGPWA